MQGLEEKEGIVCTKMLRAKCNLLVQDALYGTDFYHPPHVDLVDPTDNNYSLIYYNYLLFINLLDFYLQNHF